MMRQKYVPVDIYDEAELHCTWLVVVDCNSEFPIGLLQRLLQVVDN